MSTAGVESRQLLDRKGRHHFYLRISVTDVCNQSCTYCVPAKGRPQKPPANVLTDAEIVQLAAAFVELGVRRIRITGGEPLLRAGVEGLVASLAALSGDLEISLTTNGTLLAERAQALAQAGLDRVNVSLDSLRPGRYRRITQGGDLVRALAGIQAARSAGLVPVKLNTLVLPDLEPDEARDIILWCNQAPDDFIPRFIEQMPFEQIAQAGTVITGLQKALARQFALVHDQEVPGQGPAAYWRVANSGLRVGFIAPLSQHFCAHCNRLRLTADGQLFTCLGFQQGVSLRELLRDHASQEEILATIRESVWNKPGGHACAAEGGQVFPSTMPEMGG